MRRVPRLLLAAPASGSGKTTLTCALLAAMRNRGLCIAPFKCGPDYADPMLHTSIVGTPSYNLDLFLSDESDVRHQLCSHALGKDVALIEGVMGYYDGLGGTTDRASSWHVATVTKTPVVLVVNAKGTALTLAAQLRGLLSFREPHQLAGFLLNACSEALYTLLAPMLEEQTGLCAMGYMPPMPDCTFESRHLGLAVDAATAAQIEKLAYQAEKTIQIDRLLAVAHSAPSLLVGRSRCELRTSARPRIAIAKDEAFCFHYQANGEVLEALGAELVPFSPLEDDAIPQAVHALYLPGGYPELYATELSNNVPMRHSVLAALRGGLPALAEGGGFLYLHRELEGEDGRSYPMAGFWPHAAMRTPRLVRFGYAHLTPRWDTAFLHTGLPYPVHEFHRWDSEDAGEACVAKKPLVERSWNCMVAEGSVLMGFPQWYFPGCPNVAEGLVCHGAQRKERDDRRTVT